MSGRSGIRRTAVAAAALAALVLTLGGAGPAGAGSGRTVVKAKDFEFSPDKVTVQVGTKVVWKQIQGDHTVTKGGFEQLLAEGNAKRVFNQRGTWRYYCRFHRDDGMKGKVVVE